MRILHNTKTLLMSPLALMLLSILTWGQEVKPTSWPSYAPSGSSFTMLVPSSPLSAQGHIFDPLYEKSAFRSFTNAKSSRAYNFEINKDGKRHFLVSILDVRLTKARQNPFNDSEVRMVNLTIGDGILTTNFESRATSEGRVASWTYKKKEGLGDDDKEDGTVYVKTAATRMVIIVVAYDYAEAGDADIRRMLESLTLTTT